MMDKREYNGPERRSEDRRESQCPMTEEQAYKMLFTLEKLSKDQNQTQGAINRLIERIDRQEDNEMKRIYAGKVVLAIGTFAIYMIGWGVEHFREISNFFKTLSEKQ